MSGHDAVLIVRLPSTVRDVVLQAGERSAATRALLVVGAAMCGLDLSDARAELAELLSGRLRPEVREQLLALISGGVQPHSAPLVALVDDTRYEDEDELLGDADGAGFDV